MSIEEHSKELAGIRNEEGRCIISGKKEKNRRRGLCNTHYQKYVRAKAKLSEDDIPKWEEALIEAGLLLPDARAASDPFAEMASKMKLGQVINLGRVSETETAHPLEITTDPAEDDVPGKIKAAVTEHRASKSAKKQTKKTSKKASKRTAKRKANEN